MSKSIPIDQAVRIALEQHHAGQYARAEALYVEILRQDPGNIDALHLLGVLACQGKQPETAVQLISKAISRQGDVAAFHYNLGEALVALGRWKEAIAAYRRAIELAGDYLAALVNLSNCLNTVGDFEQAEASARRALALEPGSTAALNNLGNALRGRGADADAATVYKQALALDPDYADVVNNLAMCFCAMKRFEEGAEQFRRLVELRPTIADAYNNHGTALVQLQRHAEAVTRFNAALEIRPDHLPALNNLGSTLRVLGRPTEAVSYFEKAIALDPNFADAHANLAATFADLKRNEKALEHVDRALERRPNASQLLLFRGMILRDLRRLDEGIVSIRASLAICPDDTKALTSLGYALLEHGELDEAMEVLTRSIEHGPDPQTLSNILMTVNYHPRFSPADLLRMHRRWADLHERPLMATWKPHSNDRTEDRKLRVAYLSPDFRGHAVSYFLEPILRHHDRGQFEVFGYANVVNFDLDTYRLRTQVDHWRETAGKSDDEIERMIRKDEIDIVVDLAGHTGGNLLPVIARKPAPVQINMIGFPSTTGLSAIDYRITDTLCDPVGVADEHSCEKLIRMPHCFWVYEPPSDSLPIGELPADRNRYVTFTSVNNFTKVTPQAQSTWARLLKNVPTARLIIQTSAMSSALTRDRVHERFAAEGVDANRIEFRPWSNLIDYLRLLEQSDITLDPFPFNGGTTTCHSLWMGAPVLTLAGDRHASRMGLSILTHVGLPEFVAFDVDQYVEIGSRMAGDLTHLREVRRGMRDRLRASPLLDGSGFTAQLEIKYREIWNNWCRSMNGGDTSSMADVVTY